MAKFKKKMVQCATRINRGAVRRQAVNGVEHVIVSSFTLPDNVVMNGGLYPAEEIEASFETLERTLAPVEHPTDAQGNFISASDPEAIHNFHAGAFNVNVSRKDGRVHIEKHINVQEAMKTDRGKRLMDRIVELETNANPRPVHTSVGVFLEVEELEKPGTTPDGEQYTWIARNMFFDHDAILLDSVGAAQPSQGVGMAVNAAGDSIKAERVVLETAAVRAATNLPLADSGRTWDSAAAVQRVRAAVDAEDGPNAAYSRFHLWYDAEDAENFGAYKLPFVDIIDGEPHAVPAALRNAAARLAQTDGPTDTERERIRTIIDGYLEQLRTNAEGPSFCSVMERLQQQINGVVTADWLCLVDVYGNEVIFETPQGYFTVPWNMSDGKAVLAGIPVRVERIVRYEPVTNSQTEGENTMFKEFILNALAKAGIKTDGLSDEQLLAKFNETQAAAGAPPAGGEGQAEAIAQAVTNAVKPLQDQVTALQGQLTANADAERGKLVETVVNSGKYAGLDTDAAKALPLEALKQMAANCSSAHGVPLITNDGKVAEGFSAPTEMPK